MGRPAVKALAPLLLLALVAAGCGHDDKAEETKMKAGYGKRYTIDDVPPAQREMVKAMMNGSKNGKPPSPKP